MICVLLLTSINNDSFDIVGVFEKTFPEQKIFGTNRHSGIVGMHNRSVEPVDFRCGRLDFYSTFELAWFKYALLKKLKYTYNININYNYYKSINEF